MLSLSASEAVKAGWVLRTRKDGIPVAVAPDGTTYVRAVVQHPTVRIGATWYAPAVFKKSPSFIRSEA